jgi:16S rRNA (adenine1518-N6/adenine1519-N6)-dimethyltransferase
MDLTSPKQASDLLRAHNLRPQKRLGQNFLCDRNTLDRIVRAANLSPDDPVLEIGGGLGALTRALAAASSQVTTIEIDRHLEPILRATTADLPNVNLVFADFLRLDLPALFAEAFGDRQGVVVANIPYYITTPILEKLLDNKAALKRIVVLVQTEVARRAVAAPGSDECGSLSLYAQYHAKVEIAGTVPRTVFLPQPEVESAILALSPVVPGTVEVGNEERMFYLIRAAFGQRRKTLLNALLRAPVSFGLDIGMEGRAKAEAILARAGIDGNRRGETLSLPEFARLSDAFE